MMSLLVPIGLFLTVATSLSLGNSLVQFSFQEVTASELQDVIDAPIERSGGLDSYLSVLCVTEPRSARPGFDYVERDSNDSNSAVIFLPGEKSKSCTVRLLNDAHYEPTETFLIHLKNVESNSERIDEDRLGPNDTVLVRIINDEDAPTIQFQRNEISVHIPNGEIGTENAVTSTLLAIIRTGDQNHTSKVRIRINDGSETASFQYNSTKKILVFQPDVRVQLIEVDIVNSPIEARGRRDFKVELVDNEDLVSAKLGTVKLVVVTVYMNSRRTISTSEGASLFSSKPIITSLLYYGELKTNSNLKSSPPSSHPLVCVTPCDSNYPGYDEVKMSKLCANIRFDLRYSWEIAISVDQYLNNSKWVTNQSPVFRRLDESNLFAEVDAKVLDSIHFRAGFWVRCAVQSIVKDILSVTSKAVLIKEGQDSCRFSSQSFVATLKYSGADGENKKHSNRLHVKVKIPHQDGILPLISTRPLHNPATLLSLDSVQRRQEHPCSNLLLPREKDALLGDSFLKDHEEGEVIAKYPYEHNSTLRGNDTLILYRHLNRDHCQWTFDAWYHMVELVDLCGGYTLTNSRDVENGGQITVRLPLYVSYVFASSQRGLMIIEHHTEMDFSFEYNAVLLNTDGLQSTHNRNEESLSLHATIQIQRIGLGEAGCMIVDFQTIPTFKGLFMMRHRRLSGHQSQLIPPSNLILSFDLKLLWTAHTYDSPIQKWRAISNYSLKDYSGTYILELIPCTVYLNHTFLDFDNVDSDLPCTPHLPQRFEIPVEFHQTNRPVPVVYSLNAHFELLNDEHTFLSSPTKGHLLLKNDAYRTFSKGENVLGRVLWHPEQDLRSAYKLTVERVYGCTGRDGYVPVYDPMDDEFGGGPQFGCIRSSKRLNHRILILDRSRPDTEETEGFAIDAQFAENIPNYRGIRQMPGVDGFIIPADDLYKIDNNHRWFLQVVYTIEPNHDRNQFIINGRSKRSATINGTNIQSLLLISRLNGSINTNDVIESKSHLGDDPKPDRHHLKVLSMPMKFILISTITLITILFVLLLCVYVASIRRQPNGITTVDPTITVYREPTQITRQGCTVRVVKSVRVRRIPADDNIGTEV